MWTWLSLPEQTIDASRLRKDAELYHISLHVGLLTYTYILWLAVYPFPWTLLESCIQRPPSEKTLQESKAI
jgi:hypothetical protein